MCGLEGVTVLLSSNASKCDDVISNETAHDNDTFYPEVNEWPTVSVYVISCCYGVTSVLGVIGNGLVLAAFVTERRLLRSNFNLFVLNLTAADLCVCGLDLPFQTVINQMGYWPLHYVACALLIFCDWGMTFVSILTLVAISVDRYWAACWCQSYRIHNTRRRTLICVALIWGLLTLTWMPAYLLDRIPVGHSDQRQCDFSLSANKAFTVYLAVAGYHLPSLVMIFCYCQVYVAVRRAGKTVSPSDRKTTAPAEYLAPYTRYTQNNVPTVSARVLEPSDRGGGGQLDGGQRKELKVFRSLSAIILTYLVLWTPCHVVVDVLVFDQSLVSDDLYSYASALAYFNSALNPLLYAASSEQTIRSLRRLFCSRWRGRRR